MVCIHVHSSTVQAHTGTKSTTNLSRGFGIVVHISLLLRGKSSMKQFFSATTSVEFLLQFCTLCAKQENKPVHTNVGEG